MNLTEEQLEIVEAARDEQSLAVRARAGTGKTTTNKAIALDQTDKRFLYLAFNKKVADEAKASFPSNVSVMTAHSLAYRAVGKHFKDRICRSPYKIKTELSERFSQAYASIGAPAELEQVSLFAALEAITTFCASADVDIDDVAHVPEGPYENETVGALARGMWQAMSDPGDWAPISDDVYLKIWQLAIARGQSHAGKTLAADKTLFDEAQDASPAMLDVVRRSGIPLILTGDKCQAIYGWRGAIDAFAMVDFMELSLTQSWRFGPEIAQPANDILTVLGEFHLIDGRGPKGKVVVHDDSVFPQAIIARTNTGIVTEAVRIVDDGGSIHIVGGHEQIFSWLRAAYELWKFEKTQHPAFTMFRSWQMLKLASGQSIGRNYKPFVNLVESYRTEIPNLLMRLEMASVPADKADTVLSSVHRFKGQEAGYVKIADDFGPFCTPNLKATGPAFIIDEEEANLAYVAVTRARVQLDLGGFAATLRESLTNARKLLDLQPAVF